MTVVFRSCLMLAVVSAVVGGQQTRRPPTPPTPPTPPVVPTPAPRVIRPIHVDVDTYRSLERLRANEDLRAATMEASRAAVEASREISRAAVEASREATREAMEASRQAMEASRTAPMALRATRDAMGQIEALTPVPLHELAQGVYSMPGLSGRGVYTGPFFQSDPADSLFRRANQLLGDYDYRAAAQRVKELQTKYPNSRYVSQARYLQAFALYRSDTDAELREALSILDQFIQKYPNARIQGENGYIADARNLTNRINSTLAQRGDAAARQAVARAASSGEQQTCDREDLEVKKSALSALWHMDQAQATPKFEQVLARRDNCSHELRRFALQTITSRGDQKSVALLLSTAKSDPSPQMRMDAVSYVARYPNDDVLAALEQIAKSDTSESIRRTAARSLVGYPSPRARTVVRTIIEDNTVSDDFRCEILNRYNEERGSSEDATWMKASYSKLTSNRVKGCMLRAVGNIGGTDSQKWLMDIAFNEQETSQIRAAAFSRVSQSMSVADLSRQYDNAGNRNMRQSVIQQLNQRKEPEALDKLVDITKKTADFEIKRQIIQMLSNRNDPKAKQALLDIIDK